MWEIAGSLIGQYMQQQNFDKIAQLRAEAMQRYGNTNLSTLEALAKEELGPSKLNGVSMNEKYKGAEDAALDKLRGVVDSNGLDAQSVNRLNQTKNAALGVARGMRGANEQDLAQRGLLGSGAQVQGSLNAQQAGIDREYNGSLQTASDANDRALKALMGYGDMARGLGQDDLGQKNMTANADDRIAQFNLGHKTSAEEAYINAQQKKAALMAGVGDQQAGDQEAQAARTGATARSIGAGLDTIQEDQQKTGQKKDGSWY